MNKYLFLIGIRRNRSGNQIQPTTTQSDNTQKKENPKRGFWNVTYTDVLQTIFTGILVWLTYSALETIKISKAANDISNKNYLLAKEMFDSSNKSGKENFDLSKQSLGAQLKIIKKNDSIFKITNTPYLQIDSISIFRFAPNKPMGINYIITNLKNIPVKIIQASETAIIRYNPPKFSQLNTKSVNLVNQYIVQGAPIRSYIGDYHLLPNDMYNETIEGKYFVYYMGEIKYIDLVNHTNRKYKSIIRITVYRAKEEIKTFYEFVYNENLDD